MKKYILLACFTIILVTGCTNKENNKKEMSNLKDSERVEVVENKDIVFNNITSELSNTKCDSKNKKVNYTLKLVDGKITIINEDNFENYLLTGIDNVKQLGKISYTDDCSDTVYILLTEVGDVYYTNNDIVNFKDIKNINKEFKRLDTSFKFSNLNVENEVYSTTTSGEIIKLNFR